VQKTFSLLGTFQCFLACQQAHKATQVVKYRKVDK
jgi:hypothetical protein